MLNLGKDVLKKIQSLLVQIDKQPSKKKKNQEENQLQLSRNNTGNIHTAKGYGNNNNDSIPKSLSKSKPKQQKKAILKQSNLHKRTNTQLNINQKYKSPRKQLFIQTNQNNKQNTLPLTEQLSQRLNKLYLDHFRKQEKIFHINTNLIEQQILKNKQFKVQNRVSKYINEKKKLKPIYQRSQEILMNRQKSIQKIREQLPPTKQEIQQFQYEQILSYRRQHSPKLTKEQFQQRRKLMEERNFIRLQKIQKQKIQNFQKMNKEVKEKPKISKSSLQLYQKQLLKKNLSKNLLERFEQYNDEKHKNWDNFLMKRMQQETPFAPKINQVSKVLASRSKSKRSLYQKGTSISRSCSCKHLVNVIKDNNSMTQRHNQSISSNSKQKSQFSRILPEPKQKYYFNFKPKSKLKENINNMDSSIIILQKSPSTNILRQNNQNKLNQISSKHKQSVTTADNTSYLRSSRQNQSSYRQGTKRKNIYK